MHINFLASPYLTYTLCAILTGVILFMWFYWLQFYGNLTMPDQYHSKTVSTEYSASDVAHHYFMYKQKISQIIVREKKQFIKPFNNLRFNLNTKKYIFNISKPPSSPPLKGFYGLGFGFCVRSSLFSG